MWNAIVQWDRDTFFAINNGLQHPVLDVVMPLVSDLGLGHVQALAVTVTAIALRARKRDDNPWDLGYDARLWIAKGRPWLILYMVVAIVGGLALRKGWVPPLILAVVPLVCVVALSLVGKRRVWVAPLIVAFALSGIIAGLIKQNVDRHRPAWFYHHEHEAGRSLDRQVHTMPGRRPIRVRGFLSGHTATSVALATAFTLLARRRKWGIGLVACSWIIAGLVSFSRIYTADHWPLDVVAGAVLGVASGFAGVWLGSRWAGSRSEIHGAPTGAGKDASQTAGSA